MNSPEDFAQLEAECWSHYEQLHRETIEQSMDVLSDFLKDAERDHSRVIEVLTNATRIAHAAGLEKLADVLIRRALNAGRLAVSVDTCGGTNED